MAFVVNGVSIKNPTAFKIERYNVTTMTRLSNADMTGDLIAKKHKFFFTYDAITAADLDKILEAIWDSDALFFTLEYPYQGQQRSATVYVGSIPSDLHRGDTATGDNVASRWIWKGVTFNLIEK
jgi:hypothetical protein